MNFNQPILKNSIITKRDFWKVFMRSCTFDAAWNYERQQHLMYCYTMIPILKRVYQNNSKEMADALVRHMEFMSCTPHIATLLCGITGSMEEQNAMDKNFDATSISAVKTSLMGPMAGLGDSFFYGTLLTIAVGIGVSFAQQGSIIGPILFLLIINVPGFLARYYCLKFGFSYGVKFFSDMSNNEIIHKITQCASVLGLMVIGAMIATTVRMELIMTIGVGKVTESVQTYIDQIMPSFLPACAFGIMYWLVGKKVKTTTILIGLVVLGCLASYLKIM